MARLGRRALLAGLAASACGRARGRAAASSTSAPPVGASTMSSMTPTQRDALGDTRDLPPSLARALGGTGFAPMPRPGPDDWLAAHPERGQTYADYVASRPPRPDATRRTLALLPLGAASREAPSDLLRAYMEAFFAMPARLLPPVSVDETHATTRTNASTGKPQILAPDVLDFLRSRLPDDAFALCAFTREDLYPEPSWNFVFGQASLRERVGVFGFARYDPSFFGAPRRDDDDRAMRRRCMNVLAHETGHMFGLAHCVYFACVMNGSNHLAETDRRPFHACPVCLRKLAYAIGFDPASRYRALARVYADAGEGDEQRWTEERIAEIAGGPPG